MNHAAIAISLPPTIKKQLERLCFGIPNALWIEPHDLYLTLFSFSKIDGVVLLDIQEKLKELDFPPFNIAIQGIDCQHNKGKKGMIWAKIAPTKELELLMKLIENKLKEIPLIPDYLKIIPFIKLGTFENGEPKNLVSYLEANTAFTTSQFKIDTLILFQTHTAEKQRIIPVEHSRYTLGKADRIIKNA